MWYIEGVSTSATSHINYIVYYIALGGLVINPKFLMPATSSKHIFYCRCFEISSHEKLGINPLDSRT